MEYVKLGNTGLDVSKICLGCMSFGEPERGYPSWSLDEEKSRKVIKKALELGINFFDTANIYSDGSSEEILGRALKDYANRDEVVIATKVCLATGQGPNQKGLSRKHIFTEVEKSLQRLQTDYIDLYIIHRWDENTPIEETMEALHDLVKMGKVRYIGCSSCYAWQFAKAQHIAQMHGWTQFVSMQNKYNLLYREEEPTMTDVIYGLDNSQAKAMLAFEQLYFLAISSTRLEISFSHSSLYKTFSDFVCVNERVVTSPSFLASLPPCNG